MRPASCVRAISASRDASVRAGSAGIVKSARAIVALGSLSATPTRFDPGSIARIRISSPYGEAVGVGAAVAAAALEGAPDWTT